MADELTRDPTPMTARSDAVIFTVGCGQVIRPGPRSRRPRLLRRVGKRARVPRSQWCGKTTTQRILLGLLRADAGSLSLFGADPWRDSVSLHGRLAYVPGEVTLWPSLSGGETIDVLGRLRTGYRHERRDDLVARFDLDPSRRSRPTRRASSEGRAHRRAGMRGGPLPVRRAHGRTRPADGRSLP